MDKVAAPTYESHKFEPGPWQILSADYARPLRQAETVPSTEIGSDWQIETSQRPSH